MIQRNLSNRVLACCVWLGIETARAEYRFDVWTVDQGLPNNSISTMLQTRDGYLWLGTPDGLARFDGVRFAVFNKGNSPGLPGNRITALYEDRDGALWIGLEDGALARLQHGRFTTLSAPRNGLPTGIIGSISGDAEGNVWVITSKSGGRWNAPVLWKGDRFAPCLPEKEAALFGLPTDKDPRGPGWVVDANALHLFERGRLTTLAQSNGLPSLRVITLGEDRNGSVWIVTEDGLVKVQDGRVVKVYTQQDGLPNNGLARVGYPPIQGPLVCEDSKGNLWLSGAGPWLGRLKDGHLTDYPSSLTLSSQPLPSGPNVQGVVTTLLEDREGSVWICTDGGGLIRAREQVVNVLSTGHGLAAKNIYPICEDHAGTVWIGTWSAGLARFQDGIITNFPGETGHPLLITALYEDHEQRLWVACSGSMHTFREGGLGTSAIPSELRGKEPVSTGETVNAIIQDREGALWFGGDRGLYRFQHGRLSLFTNQVGLAGAPIKVIIEDHAGALWIGTQSGLTRVANGRFTTWTEHDGLPSNQVRALYEDQGGTLWIGTADGGLGRLKDGTFTRYTVNEGMFDNGVFQILEDGRGNFWMSSNRGIHRVSKQQLDAFAEGRRRAIDSVSFGKSDGMLNPECNGGRWPAGVKTRDGKLWFPTQDGVAVIDPETMPANPRPPEVVIESLLLDRKPLALDGPVRVPPGNTSIEIQYTALSLINSERLRFKYRLADWDPDWVEAGTRRTAYYSHVAPGRHRFTVLAANSDGLWNETGASLDLTFLPAWYQTTLSRALALVAVFGAGFWFYRSRIARLESQRVAQQDFSRRLLESQEQERQRLAGELHDSLGQELVLVKNLATLAQQPSGADPLSEISAASSRALDEVHAISYALRPPELDRLGLAKALHGMILRAERASAIRFEPRLELDGPVPEGMDIQLFRIAQEAVNNIVKYSGAKSACVELWRDPAGLHLVVSDDGCGLDGHPADGSLSRQGSASPRTGLGMAGIQERVRLLSGQHEWFSRPSQGTTLSVLVPLGNSGEDVGGA